MSGVNEKDAFAEDGQETPMRPVDHGRSSVPQKAILTVLLVCLAILGFRSLSSPAETENINLDLTIANAYRNVGKRAVTTTGASPAPAATSTSLETVFEVYPPVFGPSGAIDEHYDTSSGETTSVVDAASSPASSCQIVLMQYDFANSYGVPYVGEYTPPPCTFNRVIMYFIVQVQGVQYDRLALMYFNDTEVWRTSTAEPTEQGVEWTYVKDMSEYLYFWKSPQKLIFDLGNIYDSTFTGIYNTTLTATFWEDDDTADPADLIIPISARAGNSDIGSVFVVPGDNATNTISFPRNVNRAVFSVASCGQSTEEFWWSNVLQSDVDTFESEEGTLYGYSPFREVQVLLDGKLAGVQWPFPVIFTGGVVPELWNPIVGIEAFDLREYEIDISPWLPLLCDGEEHTFTIKVVGIIDDGNTGGVLSDFVGDSWYVTGKIFVWLDEDDDHITTGTTPVVTEDAPTITTSQIIYKNSTGGNESLIYTADVKRTLSISSTVTSQNGSTVQTWSQTITAANNGALTNYSYFEINQQATTGLDVSTGAKPYSTSYYYFLYANTTEIVYDNVDFDLRATIKRENNRSIFGNSVFPTGLQDYSAMSAEAGRPSASDGIKGTFFATNQTGTASYISANDSVIGFGTTSQEMTFGGEKQLGELDTEFYYRNVEGVNMTVVTDEQILFGKTISDYDATGTENEAVVKDNILNPKMAMGRGPGDLQAVLVQSSSSH